TYNFDLGASRVANLALDTALGSIEVVNGIAQVDTLFIALENSRLAASGSWGLRSPAAEPLRFALSSPDLSALSRVIAPDELIPPALAGSVDAQGVVGGSVEYPMVEGELTGADLRYEDWRAATLEVTADVQRDPLSGWGGQLSLTGDDLVIPNVQDLQTVRFEASGNESALAVGLFARRDAASDLALSGILEL